MNLKKSVALAVLMLVTSMVFAEGGSDRALDKEQSYHHEKQSVAP